MTKAPSSPASTTHTATTLPLRNASYDSTKTVSDFTLKHDILSNCKVRGLMLMFVYLFFVEQRNYSKVMEVI